MNMKKLQYLLIACFIAFQAFGQDDSDDLINMSLEELMQMNLSVGSQTIKNPDQVPGAITIIEKEQINQLKARTLRDVLNVMVPGMDVVPTYFKYGNPVSEGIYSRGILSDFNQQILILFNGENKFNESTFGSPYTGLEFTLENVERIEINNSPAPLMGGGALVTINIVTREQNLSGTEVLVNGGFNSDDGLQSKRFTVNYGQYVDAWHVGTSIQYSSDMGQAHPDISNSVVPGFDVTYPRDGLKGGINFNFNLKSPNEKFEFGSWYKNTNKDAYFSNQTVSQSTDLFHYQTSVFHNYLKYKLNSNINLSAGASNFSNKNMFNLFQRIPEGVNQSINLPFENEVKNFNYYLKAEYLKDYEFMGSQTLFAGFKLETEGQSDHAQSFLDSETNTVIDVTDLYRETFFLDLPDDSRTIYSVFAENNWNLNQKLSFLYGFRFENYDNFGDKSITAFNPRLAFAYLPSDNWVIRGLYSTAVRPPSNYEISGNKFLPGLYGNNNVTFEKLSTLELSLKYKKSGFEINLNPFYQKFNNRITYVIPEIDVTTRVATNSGELEVKGLEFTTKYSWKSGNYVFFNGALIDSHDKLENTQTPFIPSSYFNGGFNLIFGDFGLNSTVFYRGERQLPSELVINSERAGGSHFNLNLTGSYLVKQEIEVYFLVENLMDTENFVPLSRDGLYVPLRGRTLNLGLNLKF